VCANAAENGNLEMLQWLRERGCPWNNYVCRSASELCHEEMLQWIHENGRPCWHKCKYTAKKRGK
jgi:hypothetical protein